MHSASSFGSMASSRFSLGRQQHKFELKVGVDS